ncbi:MAG: ATP-binding protein, partial [Chloroflexota bacterium]
MQHAGKIFGVFQRLYTQDEYDGAGIGLAIVKSIVERHAGRVWCEAQPGMGAVFYFTIPDDLRPASPPAPDDPLPEDPAPELLPPDEPPEA